MGLRSDAFGCVQVGVLCCCFLKHVMENRHDVRNLLAYASIARAAGASLLRHVPLLLLFLFLFLFLFLLIISVHGFARPPRAAARAGHGRRVESATGSGCRRTPPPGHNVPRATPQVAPRESSGVQRGVDG